jgi:pyruvate formate-lyase/glycerol dehydratase family glycyl radical enzyme
MNSQRSEDEMEPIQSGCSTFLKGNRSTNAGFSEVINASPRIQRLRDLFFTNRPSICIERARIVYQYYSNPRNQSLPLILQRAGAFRAVLDQVPIRIYPDELLAGSLASRPRAYPMFPENFGDLYSRELETISSRSPDPFDISEADKKELQEEIFPFWKGKSANELFSSVLSPEEWQLIFRDPDDLSKSTGLISLFPALLGTGGHSTLDYPKLLSKGFRGIREEALAGLEQVDSFSGPDIEKTLFYRAVVECCEGMIGFGLRYSRLAEEMASKEPDPERRQELETISQVCSRVPGSPARSFHEALQSLWFAYLAIVQEDYNRGNPLGRIDSFLYPFYQSDRDGGRLTVEQAQDLLDCLWMKLGETNHVTWGLSAKMTAGFPVQQQIPVGGQTPDGNDATNPLTYQCIQATMNTRLHQPSITVRLHKESPPELYVKAAQLACLGTGHPSFFNDEVVVPALVKNGIAAEHARDYSSVGCVGAQVSGCGKGTHNGGYLNTAAALEFTLTNGYWRYGQKQVSIQTGDPRQFGSFDQFWEAFERQFRHMIRAHLSASIKVEYLHARYNPTPYLSSLTRGCLESGRDKTKGGAAYNLAASFRAVGLADVADSLIAVKKMVFEEKQVSMDRLLQALEVDFEGEEALRRMLINRCPHYGNDDDYADEMARKVVDVLTDEGRRHGSYFGGNFQLGFGSVSGHWPFGAVLGAFPDGRKAGEPLADGIGPVHNRDKNSPTGVLKSVGKMDHIGLSGGSILNFKFPPQVVAGEKGLANFVGFLKSFVQVKAWHCQFNIVDADLLREAQRNPENYQDLLVRVAGYSAYFVGLSKELQDDIIDRTEHFLQ